MSDEPSKTITHLERARTWIAALLGFFGVLLVLVLMQRQVAPGMDYAADDAYLDLTVARTLMTDGTLGLSATSLTPATTDTLWQILLSLGLKVIRNPLSVPVLLGTLLGLLAILNTQTMARYLNAISWAGSAAILLAVSSSLPLDVLRGRSLALSMAVVAMLLLRYLEGSSRARWPLPLGAAWWAGLAALVHVELLVVWVAVALHAVITGPLRRGRGHGVLFPLIRVLSSVVIVGMVLVPALAWNFKTISVPWPRFPDAPLSLDAWAVTPAGDMLARSFGLTGSVVAACYARALSVPILQGGLPVIFLLLGLGYTVVDAARDRQRLTGTVGLALLLVPLLYAFCYPYVGWNSSASVFGSLQPAWALLIALGVGRSAATICRMVPKLVGRDLPWLSPAWASAVLVTILALTGVLRQMKAGRVEFGHLSETAASRERLLATWGPSREGDVVAADRVGWLAYQRPGRYLDLTGGMTPVLLAFRQESGWQGTEAAAYLREQGVSHVVTWAADYAFAETALGCAGSGPFPRLCRVR